MTAKTWQGCVKIHEGCGGICKWVEALHTPGVGYYGECLHCSATQLTIEDMVPVSNVDPDTLRDVPIDQRKQVDWNDGEGWLKNQERIKEELGISQYSKQIDRGASESGN